MEIVWQGDHKLLDGTGEKETFERAAKLAYPATSTLFVIVRRKPSGGGYQVHVADASNPDADIGVYDGGLGEDWVAQFRRKR
jgi:hypothetical protein